MDTTDPGETVRHGGRRAVGSGPRLTGRSFREFSLGFAASTGRARTGRAPGWRRCASECERGARLVCGLVITGVKAMTPAYWPETAVIGVVLSIGV